MRLTFVAVVLAVATQTAHAATVEVSWTNCFGQTCSPKEITLGDSINFKYNANHNVVKVSTEAEYTAWSTHPPPPSNVAFLLYLSRGAAQSHVLASLKPLCVPTL